MSKDTKPRRSLFGKLPELEKNLKTETIVGEKNEKPKRIIGEDVSVSYYAKLGLGLIPDPILLGPNFYPM